jgi:hypothetical protein
MDVAPSRLLQARVRGHQPFHSVSAQQWVFPRLHELPTNESQLETPRRIFTAHGTAYTLGNLRCRYEDVTVSRLIVQPHPAGTISVQVYNLVLSTPSPSLSLNRDYTHVQGDGAVTGQAALAKRHCHGY